MLQRLWVEVPSTLAGCRWRSERCRPRVPGVLVQTIRGPWISLHARLFSCSFSDVRIPSLCIPERWVVFLLVFQAEGIVLVVVENVLSRALASPLVQRLHGRQRIERFRRKEYGPRRVPFRSFCGRRGHNITTCPENYA